MRSNLILGIETSCDETAAAVVEAGERILSNVIASQHAVHAPYGGVVPELASRCHVARVLPVIRQALKEAAVETEHLGAVAVTRGPGLIGALLVGVSTAKALAYGAGIPLVGIHHLEAHITAVALEKGWKGLFPAVALVVSGGHTHLFHARDLGDYRLLGRTLDDAAGEAFDKVAKILHLEYPGGPAIDRLAREGNPEAVAFPRAYLERDSLDFSFSGLKTAVLYYVRGENGGERARGAASLEDVAASFEQAVVDVLVRKALRAVEMAGVRTLILAGGVAANHRLRTCLGEAVREKGFRLLVPSPILCTDNAAMVAALAYPYAQQDRFAGLDLTAQATWPLG